MKRIALALVTALLLTSCSGGEEQEAAPLGPEFYVPGDCTATEILAALPDSILNPIFIDTPWEPAEGTDLFEAYSRGGIACTYGIQEAEIGATILWSPDDEEVFNSRISEWTKAGQVKTDLPGIDEGAAYVLAQGDENSVERHVWSINLLIDGFWIQVNATFLQTIDEAIPLVKAAIESLVSREVHEAKNITGCYVAEVGGDFLTLELDQKDRNLVAANMKFFWAEKEQSEGQMIGSYTNQVLSGIYDFSFEDGTLQREVFFKGDKSGFILGFSSLETKDGVARFQRPLQIKWDEKYKYLPSDKCNI
jgi:hypothetical protein